MPDYQAIIDEIRGILLSSDATRSERDEPLARDYAQACAEANGRLAGSQKLLKQGLRAEALHAAKSQPDLIEGIESLFFFTGRADWLERVEMYALPASQALDEEAFASLQEAFAEEAPLQNLLRKHRRLAMARAPLRERIGVLRRLAEQDPTSPIWLENIGTYEAVRIEQIRHEAARARANRDVAGLSALEAELSSSGWTVSLPPNVLADVRRALAQFRKEDARRELAAVELELNEAHSAFDYARARTARGRWTTSLNLASLPSDDPLLERAEPALEWLARRDRDDQEEAEYQHACGLLDAHLDEEAARGDLERAYQAVTRFDRGLPSVMQTRYEARLRAIEIEGTRRRRLVLACSVSGIVIAGSLGGWIFYQQGRSREARLVSDVIVRALDEGKLEGAIKAEADARKNDPGLLRSAETAEARSRLAQAVKAEEQRRTDFAAALGDASVAGIAKDPPESLVRARALARGEEIGQVERLEGSRHRSFEARVTTNTKEFLPKYQAVLTTIAALREAIPRAEDYEEIEKQVEAALTAKPVLADQPEFYGEELHQTGDSIGRISAEIRSEVELRRRERSATEGIARSIREIAGRPESYEAALNATLKDKQLASRPRGQDSLRVIGEKPAWSAAIDWSRCVRGWGENAMDVLSKDAFVRAKQCDVLLEKHATLPDRDSIAAIRDHFQALDKRREAKEVIEGVLSSFLFDRVQLVEVDESRGTMRYYAKSPPDGQNARFLIGFSATNVRPKVIPAGKFRTSQAPQTKHVNAIRKAFQDDPTLARWDGMMLDAMKRLAQDPKLDPIPKRILMIQMAQAGSQGSMGFRDAIGEMLGRLKDPKIPDGMYWMDPEKNATCDPVRKDIEEIIAELRWDIVAEKMTDGRAKLAKILRTVPQPVGVLVQPKKGDWQCEPRIAAPRDGRLFVIVPGAKQSAWKSVGAVKDRKVVVSPSEVDLLVQGRLVFSAPD
ncbi:MAG: hypothetical protein JWN86_784 [Planctomycetota bacterium]|nr:hypothetical protein [Planctomycetota bacterium]